MTQVRATRAYIAGFGTAGSLLAGAAILFVLASAVVSFRGWPTIGAQPSASTVILTKRHTAPAASPAVRRVTVVAAASGAAGAAGAGAAAAGAGRGWRDRTGAGDVHDHRAGVIVRVAAPHVTDRTPAPARRCRRARPTARAQAGARPAVPGEAPGPAAAVVAVAAAVVVAAVVVAAGVASAAPFRRRPARLPTRSRAPGRASVPPWRRSPERSPTACRASTRHSAAP